MKIDLYNYTNVGTRPINEDFFGISSNEKGCIAILCDGLGGHSSGEIASKSAVKNLIEGITLQKKISKENLNDILRVVNDGLLDYQKENPECDGMRTTAVGCIVNLDERIIQYFNVGDSRLYLFKNGVLNKMTKDHSVSQLSVDMGQISFNDIRGDKDRSSLLKALGQEMNSEFIGDIYKPVNIDVDDAFLLCSDGFWEYVLEEEMEADLAKSETAEEWINYMLVRLLLKQHDDNDNYSVIGGIIKSNGEQIISEKIENFDEWNSTQSNNLSIPSTLMKDSMESTQDIKDGEVSDHNIDHYLNGKLSRTHSKKLLKSRVEHKNKSVRQFSKSNKLIFACISLALVIAFVIVGITRCNELRNKTTKESTSVYTEYKKEKNVPKVYKKITLVYKKNQEEIELLSYKKDDCYYVPIVSLMSELNYKYDKTENGEIVFSSSESDNRIVINNEELTIGSQDDSDKIEKMSGASFYVIKTGILYAPIDDILNSIGLDYSILDDKEIIIQDGTKNEE